MDVASLEFRQIEGNAPVFNCNSCGRTGEARGWYMADIPLGDEGDTVSIVVCSQKCKRAFMRHPMAQAYVRDLLSRVNALRGGI